MSEEKKPYKQLENDWNTLRRHHISLKAATEQLEEEVVRHRAHSKFCTEQLENADKNVQIQKQITRDSIAQSQAEHDNLVKEILELKVEIKKLKGL